MLVCLSELLGILCVIPSMYYPCYPRLARTLEFFYVMLSLPSPRLTMGIVNIFVEFVSLGYPSRRMFYDGAGMHGIHISYL
jgi:hypothetical protein